MAYFLLTYFFLSVKWIKNAEQTNSEIKTFQTFEFIIRMFKCSYFEKWLSITRGYFNERGFQLNPHLTELLISNIIARRKKDILNSWGNIKWSTRKPAEIINTILNHKITALFRIRNIKQTIIKGFSKMIFRFHLICSWSVKKLKKIMSTERIEKTK